MGPRFAATNEAEFSGRVEDFDMAMLVTLQPVAISKHHAD
jgi:hypothetical protein